MTIRNAIDRILPALVATYVAGWWCGTQIHRINDQLAVLWVRALGLAHEPQPQPQPSDRAWALAASAARFRTEMQARTIRQRQLWYRHASTVRFQAMTVAELRKLARNAGYSRSWCRVARKADLLPVLAALA